jgi:hypothetical protein
MTGNNHHSVVKEFKIINKKNNYEKRIYYTKTETVHLNLKGSILEDVPNK